MYNENGECCELKATSGQSWNHVAGAGKGQLVQQENFYYHFIAFYYLTRRIVVCIHFYNSSLYLPLEFLLLKISVTECI